MTSQAGPESVGHVHRDSSIAVRLADALSPRVSCALRARFGHSREPELALLPDLVRAGDTVIDVGAHRGLYAYHLNRLVGSTGHVYCIEPQPDLAQYLRRALPRAVVVNAAVSDTVGTAVLSVPVHGRTAVPGHATLEEEHPGGIRLEVPMTRIDDLGVAGRVTLIKVDVEGHELAVLSGARRILDEHRPALIVETDPRNARSNETRQQLLEMLGGIGYESRPGPVNWVFIPVRTHS